MIKFSEYVKLQEMSELMTAPLDNIQLNKTGDDYHYSFKLGNHGYLVEFLHHPIVKVVPTLASPILVVNNSYEIRLLGPRQFDLTGLGNEFQVYKYLILAIRKLVEI